MMKKIEFEYRSVWREIEGADSAYQVYENNQPKFDKYIICKGDSIISIFSVDGFSITEIANAIDILLLAI